MKVSMRKRVSSKKKKKILQAHGRNWPLQVCCSQVRHFKKLKSYFHVSSSCVTSPQYSYLS